MEIINSTVADIDTLFDLYGKATEHQKLVGNLQWKGFELSLVQQEIKEQRQWKIVMNGEIACVFVITFNDPNIWEEKNEDPALYIHRIATNPNYRGNSFVKHIVSWATEFARKHDKSFIRIDTGSGNEKLNRYYESCGFTYLGVKKLADTSGLPEHYKRGEFSLFEIKLEPAE